MHIKKTFLIFCLFFSSCLFAKDFTVASYNCGGLSNHYDYIRAVCMQKLAQERYNQEPQIMAQLEKIQNTALKILFSKDPQEVSAAQEIWDTQKYTKLFQTITTPPNEPESPNTLWRDKNEAIVSDYQQRPIRIYDQELNEQLLAHIKDLSGDEQEIELARAIMAKRIFTHQMKYAIIALQEADYLTPDMFPSHYQVAFSNNSHSINGVAWDTEKFELIETLGDLLGRGFAIKLRERATQRVVCVLSAHLTGCNPFTSEENAQGELDSKKGDKELEIMLQTLQDVDADLKLLAMDSNVTATHPRLAQLKEKGYLLDYDNYLEPTCTNPQQVLNTRIDWIAVKSEQTDVSIQNIPVLGVPLNNLQANFSDHKPIAALIVD